jgi:hypothetical protein
MLLFDARATLKIVNGNPLSSSEERNTTVQNETQLCVGERRIIWNRRLVKWEQAEQLGSEHTIVTIEQYQTERAIMWIIVTG